MEEIILNLIMHSGEARSYAMESIQMAKIGKISEARQKIAKANEELGHAHNAQSGLIQGEASGNKAEFSLLLVHAQDHLMTTMTLKDLANEMIDIYERL